MLSIRDDWTNCSHPALFDALDKPKQREHTSYPAHFLQLELLDPQPYGVVEARHLARIVRTFYIRRMGRCVDDEIIVSSHPELIDNTSQFALSQVYQYWSRIAKSCPVAEWCDMDTMMNLCVQCFRPCFRLGGTEFCMGSYCAADMLFANMMQCGMDVRCRGCFAPTGDCSILCCGKAECITYLICIYRITSAYGNIFKWNYDYKYRTSFVAFSSRAGHSLASGGAFAQHTRIVATTHLELLIHPISGMSGGFVTITYFKKQQPRPHSNASGDFP